MLRMKIGCFFLLDTRGAEPLRFFEQLADGAPLSLSLTNHVA